MRALSRVAGRCALVALVAACGPRAASRSAATDRTAEPAPIEIAVYPTTALVRERRAVELARGRSEVSFAEMPSGLDVGSVRVVSLTDPHGTRAVEQLARPRPTRRGALPAWVELTDDARRPVRVRERRRVERHAPVVGGVSWTVESATGGEQQLEVRYQTAGLQWRADYTVVLSGDAGDRADVNAWITVDNRSGRTFADAEVSLVTRVPDVVPAAPTAVAAGSLVGGGAASYPAQPQPLYLPAAPAAPRYRSYAYRRRVTLRDRAQRQLEWFAAPLRGLTSRKLLVFDPIGGSLDRDGVEPVVARELGLDGERPVTVGVELPAVARALPPGRLRVFERADSGVLSMLGEAAFEGSDAGEPLRLQLGAVPGLSGRRRQTDFRVDPATRRLVEELEVELRNAGDEPHDVMVREHLYRGSRFAVTSASEPYTADGARAIRWALTVPAGGAATVRYRVVYSWDAAPAPDGEAATRPRSAVGEQP